MNEDLYAPDFPHGTEGGYQRGCRSNGACPANVEFDQSCAKAHKRYTMDHSYRRVVDNGASLEVQRTSEREIRRMLSVLNHIPEGDAPSTVEAKHPTKYETATEREEREARQQADDDRAWSEREAAGLAVLGPEMSESATEREEREVREMADRAWDKHVNVSRETSIDEGDSAAVKVSDQRRTDESDGTPSRRAVAMRENMRRQREHALATVSPEAPFGRTLSGEPRKRRIPGAGPNARSEAHEEPNPSLTFRRLMVDDWVDAVPAVPSSEDLAYLREQSDRLASALGGFDARALGDRLAEVASAVESLALLTRSLRSES